jgi:tetratricopeptide (TPR) repeat protein
MSPPRATPLPQDELEATWRELLGRKGQLRSDRKLAQLGVELIRELGNAMRHREVLRELAEAWSEDWELTLGIASLLVEQAARKGMDEPVLSEDTPARWASDALRRALDALEDPERKDPDIAGNLQASLGNALRLCGPGEDDHAQEAFDRALKLDARRGSWWYDMGLLHKWRGRFEEGLRANQMALEHAAHRRPALWNLAICATGLGNGEVARRTWSELGMPVRTDPDTDMPFVEGLPPMRVRVLSRPSPIDGTSGFPTGVGFELVWVAPLSPCHGVVQSPTFRDAPIDHGDLVLWDGAPVAEHRVSGSNPLPVFPLLEILHRGDERRWPFVALEREPGATKTLEEALPPGTRLFVQQERVAHHCPVCEGGVEVEYEDDHEDDHDHEAVSVPATVPASATVPATALTRGKIVLPAVMDLSVFREAWESAIGARALVAALPKLYEELGETKRAGQEHQAWRGIERKALRQKADR